MRAKTVAMAAAALLLSGCATVSYKTVGFDVLRPADYTLPAWTDTIVMVDNVAKPVCTDSTLPANDLRMQVNSEIYARVSIAYLMRTMKEDFKSSGYMNLRYIERRMNLTSGRIDSLLQGHPSTAILAVENYNCNSALRMAGDKLTEDNEILGCIDMLTENKTRLSLITSPYNKIELTPRTDTLIFESCGTTTTDVVRGFPSLTSRYQQMGNHVGHQYADALLPTWQRVYRSIYVTNNKDMAAAASWVDQDEWDEAKNLWYRVYSSDSKVAEKVRAAINLALAYEREDTPVEGSMWASKALDAIETTDAKHANTLKIEKQRAESMFAYFMARIKEKKALDKQMN